MNKQQAQEQLNKLIIEAEKLESIINGPDKTKEERFFELIQGLTPKWDKEIYPDSIFYFKGDKFWLEYNEKDSHVWVRYDGFWEVFRKDYGLTLQEIRDFFKCKIEEHFKWKGTTLLKAILYARLLEEQFR